jgi:hypothetical protein
VISSVARAHIHLTAVGLPPATFAARLLLPGAKRGFDIALTTYKAPLSGVLPFWQPIVGSNSSGKPLPTNLAKLQEPTIAALLASPEVASNSWQIQGDVGRMIDRLVLGSGAYIPLAWLGTLRYRGPAATNITTAAQWDNNYDIVDVGANPAVQ